MQALKQVTNVKSVDSAIDALANAITGKSFSRQERIQLEMETLSKHFQSRRQLLESSLTAVQVAQLLGTSRQTPHDRVSSQTLLAIRDNGKLCFPFWQFDPAGFRWRDRWLASRTESSRNIGLRKTQLANSPQPLS
jgi:hypothetical protein